jgi:hypothetical protein
MYRVALRWIVVLGVVCVAVACGSSGGGSSSPTAPTTTAKASLSVTSVSIQASRTGTGYQYSVTVNIHESAGVAVTVSAIDLNFSAGGTSLGTIHFDNPYSAKVGANGSATSKALIANDDVAGHAFATKIDTIVTFTDDNQHAGTANESDAVAPLPGPPAITTFSASPANITAGQPTTLQWSVASVASAVIDNGIGTVSAAGSRSVTPTTNTTYTLSATNSGGSATASVAVGVSPQPVPNPPTINSFTVSRSSIAIGESVTLQWSVSNATNVSISNGVGSVAASGQITITPLGDTNYALTASNGGGSTSRSVGVSTSVPSGICAANTVPSGTTAVCKDGSFSSSQNRSGTCSSHGGVQCWICPGVLCSGLPTVLPEAGTECRSFSGSKR